VDWQKAAIRAPISSAQHIVIAGKQGPYVKQGFLPSIGCTMTGICRLPRLRIFRMLLWGS
jgi:hypothetical protein